MIDAIRSFLREWVLLAYLAAVFGVACLYVLSLRSRFDRDWKDYDR